MRRVVHDTEAVHEVELRILWHSGHSLGVSVDERDAVSDTKDLGSSPSERDGLAREVAGNHFGASSCEIDRVGADATADLEDPLPLPGGEVGKGWDVRFYEVLPLLHLVEVLRRADRQRRVPEVARPTIPILPYSLNRSLLERRMCAGPGSHGRSVQVDIVLDGLCSLANDRPRKQNLRPAAKRTAEPESVTSDPPRPGRDVSPTL